MKHFIRLAFDWDYQSSLRLQFIKISLHSGSKPFLCSRLRYDLETSVKILVTKTRIYNKNLATLLTIGSQLNSMKNGMGIQSVQLYIRKN